MKNIFRKKINILAIETSCDETSASIVQINTASNKKYNIKILSNIVSSQVKLHAKYNGVYPELASREHIKNMIPVLEESLDIFNIQGKNNILSYQDIILKNIDILAVTAGPGLIGSLLIGVNTAKTLAYALDKPIYSINHLEGHIYANFINPVSFPQFPLVALIVSGGHTSLVYMKNHLEYEVIGETLDDAAGEAFDKVACLLNIGYPGGPIISKMAMELKAKNLKSTTNQSSRDDIKISFPRPMINSHDFNFSFSGLKTSVLYTLKKLPKKLSRDLISQIAKEFQDAVIETLVSKTIRAARKYKVKSILLGGGVSSNKFLREKMSQTTSKKLPDIKLYFSESEFCTDNAAMIGMAAAYKIILGKPPTKWYDVNANPNQTIGQI